MEMQNHVSLLVLVYALVFSSSLSCGCGSIVEGHRNKSCIASEKRALLLLKKNLIDDWNYLSSWVGDDCCAWYGIGCNKRSDHVIQLDLRNGYLTGVIHPSLLGLKYLAYLDLSCNRFEEIRIPDFFGSFKDLQYLNLSYSNFVGLVPHNLGNLSSLRHLDLNYNNLLSIDSMGWSSKLSKLEHLDLSSVNLSRATDWFAGINMLPGSVLVLKLHNCHLPTTIPTLLPFINLTSLISLDLGDNGLNFSFPSWVLNNTDLAHLNLGSNHFSGPIPDSIGSLTALFELNLSFNLFQGSIPPSIGNLTLLSNCDFSYNKLDDLIPQEMDKLTELTGLYIESNELRGCLPKAFCQMSKLESLYVSDNQLSGYIPKCIGELSNLKVLSLLSNSWEGFLSEHHFVNLTKLTSLIISSKSNLVFNVSSEWVPPFQLEQIYMESLKVGPKFPQWLVTQRRMPNTSISDTIQPEWFVSLLLTKPLVVDLFNNDITGDQLSSIQAAPNGLSSLELSNNRLSGEFPTFLCSLTSLKVLVLSNNDFSGELPQCLGNLTELGDLDVMNNSLSGVLPTTLGSLGNLTYLNLHNNKFQGRLPSSFGNLAKLVPLDVGRNNLTDTIPYWIGENLPRLRYLILRSNNFYGNIPTQLCRHHSSIQVLNLARNQITGNIPPCFGKFSAMITSDSNEYLYYQSFSLEKVRMMIDDTKGYEQKYTSTLRFLFSIDLSNNNISGEIPKELMDLLGLLNLNLAGNHLGGRIPDMIGKLKKLEFLDLSRNELYGSIPQSLSDLNFLSHLNLFVNNLSGRIPTGNQLQTLNSPTIYAGNSQLCGQPILKPCSADSDLIIIHNYTELLSDSDDEYMWVYAGIGPGLLVGFLGFCASLHFLKSWRYFLFYFVEQAFDKIALALQRKFQNK
ncbi:uncharacterized protein LOC141695973 [Apium graveolens]|uniref:uncharacterized protein LOC141695973 n=1 Tax=Apium graveolens TaxID=4045 RepID=UPI003D7ADE35